MLIANELLDALPGASGRDARGRPARGVRRRGSERERRSLSARRLTSRARRRRRRSPSISTGSASTLEPGWRVEINLRAVDWIRDAARRLRRGFIILIDYGHEARELYSPTHAAGTLTTFARHHEQPAPSHRHGAPPWLRSPGEQDITAHVDFTSVRAAAEAEGLTTLGFLDQTYFLLGLAAGNGPRSAIAERSRQRSKTLLMPGGLGSTHKVLILGKGVGTPALRGCSFRCA